MKKDTSTAAPQDESQESQEQQSKTSLNPYTRRRGNRKDRRQTKGKIRDLVRQGDISALDEYEDEE